VVDAVKQGWPEYALMRSLAIRIFCLGWRNKFDPPSRSKKGVWWRMFAAMSDDPDFEYLIVDSTIIRAHQHAAGAKKGAEDQALGRLEAA
jgi:transposase